MILFSEPSFLSSVGQVLIVLGLVGLVSLFFFPAGRRRQAWSVAGLFAAAVLGGVGFDWKARSLRAADRDLTPAQQAALGQAIGQFPDVRFEVLTSREDKEAHALALEIAAAVTSGSGARPAFDEAMPAPPMAVVLVMHDRDTDASRRLIDRVGRVLMAARVAVISDHEPDLDDRTVRIVVGAKP